MRRRAMMKKIAAAAEVASVQWLFSRRGGNHDLWQCGSLKIPIPRHNEINEWTAEDIFKDLETELGENWWRN